MLGVDTQDATDDALGFLQRDASATFPSLRDRDRELRARVRRHAAIPETFLIDRQGRIAALRRFPVDAGMAGPAPAAAAGGAGMRHARSRSCCALAARRARGAHAAARLAARHRGRGDVRRVRHARSTSPTRRSPTQERAFIREQIAAGKTKEQIKAALVDEYGARRARRAGGQGFDLDAVDRARSSLVLLAAARRSASRPRRWRRRRRRRRSAPTAAAARRPRTRAGSTRSCSLRPMSGGVDTTVIAAFAVGFVSFISPCVLPLVPGYLSAVSGVSLAEIQHGERGLSRDPAAGDRLLPVLHRRLRRARDDRHRPRLDAAGLARHARQGRRRGDHRARRVLPAHAVRAASSTASGARTR